MQLKHPIIYITVVLSLLTGCSRYIDTVKLDEHAPKVVGYLTMYADSNVFSYKTNVVLTRDTEKIYPKPFKISLPKGLRYYEAIGSTDFFFYYDRRQVLMIRLSLENKDLLGSRQSEYIPTGEELERIIDSKLTLAKNKYDIKKIPYVDGRKQLIVKDERVTLILYNIESEEYNSFKQSLHSFMWQ